MKKIIVVSVFFLINIFFITGCGQEVNVTVYNHSGITPYYDQYIGMSASWDGGTISEFPLTYAQTEDEITDDNSFTIKIKENSTISVYAWGQYYEVDSSGNTSLTELEVGPETATIYGGFPDPPEWYAAIYINEIIIYKK